MQKFVADLLFGLAFGIGFAVAFNILNAIASLLHAPSLLH
jgi:hypothetical protein